MFTLIEEWRMKMKLYSGESRTGDLAFASNKLLDPSFSTKHHQPQPWQNLRRPNSKSTKPQEMDDVRVFILYIEHTNSSPVPIVESLLSVRSTITHSSTHHKS